MVFRFCKSVVANLTPTPAPFSSRCLSIFLGMVAHFCTASPPGQLPIGLACDGRPVSHPFRPSTVQLSHLLSPHLDGIAGQSDLLSLPPGMSLSEFDGNGQLQLTAADAISRRMRKDSGYIGEIKISQLLNNLTPLFRASNPVASGKERPRLRSCRLYSSCLTGMGPQLRRGPSV